MEIMTIAGVVVIAAFLAVILRQQRPEQAMAVSLIAGVVILALVVTKALPVIGTLRDLLNSAALPSEYGAILFKALGICLLTQLAADACRDAGENALAGKAELAGKLLLLTLALPLFERIAELAASLIEGSAGT
jgi:hypothetical protein